MSKESPEIGVWQPIATVPRDGTIVLVCCAGFWPCVTKWDASQNGWIDDGENITPENFWPLTHWMPLPETPKNPS